MVKHPYPLDLKSLEFRSQVDSVNEYLFSLHLNSDLYTKLTFTQLALLYEAPAPIFIRWLFLLSACRTLHHKACVH